MQPPADPARLAQTLGARVHHLDHVRCFALLLGVVYHSAHAYSARLHVPWIVTAPEGSWVITGLECLSHLFRMAVFFFLAGFFARLLIEKRGVDGFLRNRMLRIAAPFVLFLPITGIAFFMILRAAPAQLSAPSTYLLEATGPGDGAVETAHLWFLEYLFLFCVIAAALALIRAPWLPAIRARILGRAAHVLWLPVLLVPALMMVPSPAQAPTQMLPTVWPFGYYGLFFLLGYHVFRAQDWLDRVARVIWPLAAACAALFPLFFWLTHDPSASAPRLLVAALEAWLSVYLTLIVLAVGKRLFDRPSRALRYLSDSAYWVYLVHLPIVLWLQVLLAEAPLGLWSKFAICTGATLGVSVLSYAILVRHTPIGWLLNGRRRLS